MCSGFPYIFRGALDVRARAINMEMKIAAAHALAALAREDVPDEVAAAYRRAAEIRPRLHHPGAVRSAADLADPAGGSPGGDGYQGRAAADRRHGRLSAAIAQPARSDRRCFAAGFRAAAPAAAARCLRRGRRGAGDPRGRAFVHQGLGTALLVGREARVRETAQALGVELGGGIEIINAALSSRNATYAAYLYERLQRQGFLQRDCLRLVNQDRNISPPAWSRLATPTPWSPASPAISRSRSKTCGACSIPSRAIA